MHEKGRQQSYWLSRGQCNNVSGSVRNNGNCVHEIPGFCRTLQGARRTQSGSDTRPCLNCEYQAELRKLQAAFVLPAAMGGKKRIPIRDLAKRLTFQSFIRKRTADELREHPSGASAATENYNKQNWLCECEQAAAIRKKWSGAQKSPRSGFRSPASKDPRKNGF
jgi:hypothetical protein